LFTVETCDESSISSVSPTVQRGMNGDEEKYTDLKEFVEKMHARVEPNFFYRIYSSAHDQYQRLAD
jgi:hypothetical protein